MGLPKGAPKATRRSVSGQLEDPVAPESGLAEAIKLAVLAVGTVPMALGAGGLVEVAVGGVLDLDDCLDPRIAAPVLAGATAEVDTFVGVDGAAASASHDNDAVARLDDLTKVVGEGELFVGFHGRVWLMMRSQPVSVFFRCE